ncbi:MAG: GNAT family N-acetyltransferase [Lachnospiraceae bacterium]|nr:GNAT family N-acetyltransferase [Lachnospiraceae bacterium]
MALRKAQKEMAISLFAKVFNATEDERSRKELYIQFVDAYDGSIKDWQEKVEQELVDEKIKEQFRQLYNREQQTDIKEFITVEPLRIEDLEQISYLSSKELGTGPWIREETGPDSIIEFVNGGYSYVAKREDVILGFILAYKCPAYGGYYHLYIDTFVVNSDAQGQGIGKMLFDQVRMDMFRNRIISMKLMTKREIPAYKIYKHLGLEEIENYVHMQR